MASPKPKAIKVVFGAMTLGAAGKEQARIHNLSTASGLLTTFQSHGHNGIDTASSYGEGTSETMLGSLDLQERNLTV